MRKCELDCTCGKHSEELSYGAKHLRVRKLRGNATGHPCANCGEQAKDWAQTHDTDGTDPYGHYRPMCRVCHNSYDGRTTLLATVNTGRKFTAEQREQRAEIMRRWNASLTPEQRSENTRKAWQTRRTKKVGE